ncbi:MAG: aldehyde dehydrogenase family protein [Brevibacillus sp.]|nr:aldehyde dehydrogenase family protein [Brevibacillus sp.]
MHGSLHLYIDGRWIHGEGGIRPILDPSNESVLTTVREGSPQQVDQAVQAAKKAFETTDWSTNAAKRVEILRRIAELMEKSAEEFARLETQNTGKPIRESRLDVADSIACLRYYADLVESRQAWEKDMSDGTTSRVTEEAIGVCALIVPWNFPLLLGVWKLAPALAAGNTVIFKPSEWTPLTFLKLSLLMDEVGIPAGVYNLVLGDGQQAGMPLISHPDVDKVSFTGGSSTGRTIYTECAKQLKRVSLELGGKSPLLIFEDVDIETAVDWTMFGAFFNQGQVCVASSRILVHQNLHDEFLNRLCARVSQIRIGDPLDERTEMGPIISEPHLRKIHQYVEIGLSEGAVLAAGGNRISRVKDGANVSGYYYQPTIFTHVTQSMRIVQEEIFGPVITIQAFSTEDQAIELANGTNYGLAAGVLSRDLDRAKRVSGRLKAGTIWINGYHTPHVEAPWGGFKQSGIGRELGPHGLSAFTEVKHVNTNQRLQLNGWYSFSHS